MSLKAASIGELAERVVSRGGRGEVTRVFPRSAYIRSGSDFVLLLRGELRSPVTINLAGGGDRGVVPRAGERCLLQDGAVVLGSGTIEVGGASVFRSPLVDRGTVRLPPAPALRKGVSILRSLYHVTPSGPTLAEDAALRSFAQTALVPFAEGRPGPIYSPRSYSQLVGRGGGFTPAGDDFVGGLLTTFNYVARCRRSRQIPIPRRALARTIPESAALVRYAARGHVDERLGKLVQLTVGGGPGFYDELVAVAQRGHTSGIDVSLGVILCEAALAQAEGDAHALADCLDALWHR